MKKFYIEAGAHDGIFQSQTKRLDDTGDWRGMLIEPNPNLFKKCIQNRSDNNIFINKCLVGKNYTYDTIKFYMSINGLDAMGKTPSYVYQSNAILGKEILVKTANINDLLFDNNISFVDFFSIDTEGADIDILDSIDFGITYFKKLCVEIHFNIESNINYVKDKYGNLFDIIVERERNQKPHVIMENKK